MRRILCLILILVLLTGCGITGKVIQEIEEASNQKEKDQADFEKALYEKDTSICYGIQTQEIRETCFISLAQELKDDSICNNLLGTTLRNSCKDLVNNPIFE